MCEWVRGILQIGRGVKAELHSVIARRIEGGVDVMFASNGRTVWLTLDNENAQKLARILRESSENPTGQENMQDLSLLA